MHSLAQLACCYRLQRTLDVQRQSLELADRLVNALRLHAQRHQLETEMDSNDSARRRYIGKLQQVCAIQHSYSDVWILGTKLALTLVLCGPEINASRPMGFKLTRSSVYGVLHKTSVTSINSTSFWNMLILCVLRGTYVLYTDVRRVSVVTLDCSEIIGSYNTLVRDRRW